MASMPRVGEIIEFFGDPFEIADAIAVAIRERARVDLIENSCLPPFEIGHYSSPLYRF